MKRTSWIAQYLIGLLAWNAVIILVALIIGYSGTPGSLLFGGCCGAVLQIAILRLGFTSLGLDRHLAYGMLWGALTGSAITVMLVPFVPTFSLVPWLWLIIGAFVGFLVGGILSYNYLESMEVADE